MAIESIPGWSESNGLLVPPSALRPDPQFDEFMSSLNRVVAELPEDMRKSVVAERLAKSLVAAEPQTRPLDMFEYLSMWEGVKTREVMGITDDMLRNMVRRCPPVAAIIATRCNQVAAFCQLPETETDVGFRVALRDKDRKPTTDEQHEMRRLEDMILECGLPEARSVHGDLNFEQFCRIITRDSLTVDAMPFEIIPGVNRARYPVVAWQPVDAAEIRLVAPEHYEPKRDVREIFAVQMRRGTIVAEYTRDELAYGERNPTSDIARNGYGTSELEWLIPIVSCIIFGIDYNQKYFTHSSVPPGILSVAGNLDREMQEAFRRQWQAMLQGPGNWWGTPMVFTKDGQGAKFERFRDSNRDMEFHQFIAFLVTVACSCYNIHPEEIGMQSWAAQTTTLNQPSPQSRLEASIDRGLKPILKLIATLVNQKLLWRMYPERHYVFRWVNIDPADEERELRLRQMRLEMGLSLPKQEIKQMDGEDHEFSEVPVNAYHFQAWQMQNQPQMPEQPGMPGQEEQTGDLPPWMRRGEPPEDDEPEPKQRQQQPEPGDDVQKSLAEIDAAIAALRAKRNSLTEKSHAIEVIIND